MLDSKPLEFELIDGMDSFSIRADNNGIVPLILGSLFVTQLHHAFKKLFPYVQPLGGEVPEGVYDPGVGWVLGTPLVSQDNLPKTTKQFPPLPIIHILVDWD